MFIENNIQAPDYRSIHLMSEIILVTSNYSFSKLGFFFIAPYKVKALNFIFLAYFFVFFLSKIISFFYIFRGDRKYFKRFDIVIKIKKKLKLNKEQYRKKIHEPMY